jgi:hypothetical protein
MSFAAKFRLALIVGLISLFALLINVQINLTTADLGRHLKNGEIFLQTHSVWQTNLYSYTYAGYPFVNHHWGSGVIFYLIYRAFGFSGLSVFFLLLSVATFLIFFHLAWQNSRFSLAWLLALFVLPILVSRTEIRPEAFSYLFSGIFWWILVNVKQKRLSSRFLYLLPFLMLLWVNLHIYFFLGFFLIGLFFLESLLSKSNKDKKFSFGLVKAGILSLLLSCLNPAGFKGLIYPLQIFGSFGYRLFENQAVLTLDKIVLYPPSLYFKIVFAVLGLSWMAIFWSRRPLSLVNLFLTLTISFLGWSAVRNLALFGYFALPLIAQNLSGFKAPREMEERPELEYFLAASLGGLLILSLFLFNSTYWLNRVSWRPGLIKGNEGAAEFFLKENLKGPVFNDYDNGGYLIFYLYPKEKVFVDNRPEAYPRDFFQKTYVPMQEDEKRWKEAEKIYRFNTIFFYRHDLTPWAQTFLVNRIKDASWAPVYVDDWSIIFVKRNFQNQALIQEYELPKGTFLVK